MCMCACVCSCVYERVGFYGKRKEELWGGGKESSGEEERIEERRGPGRRKGEVQGGDRDCYHGYQFIYLCCPSEPGQGQGGGRHAELRAMADPLQ